MRKDIDGRYIEEILAAISVESLAGVAESHIRTMFMLGVQRAGTEMDIIPGFDVYNPEVTRFLQEYTGLMANRVTTTVRESIRRALIDGLEGGLRGNALRDGVLEALGCTRDATGKIIADTGAKYRAEMIARTESARASHAGRERQWKEAGARAKRWRADSAACPYCQAIDGMVVEIERPFFRRGESLTVEADFGDGKSREGTLRLDYSDTPHPPLHPHCRCDVSYE